MSTVTAIIELGVGLGCLTVACAMRGRGAPLVVIGAMLAVAGTVAAVHAVWSLVTVSSP